jgi:hypothetical protein
MVFRFLGRIGRILKCGNSVNSGDAESVTKTVQPITKVTVKSVG